MKSGKLPDPGSTARPGIGTRSLPLEIDLNETPLPSPRETLAEETVPAAAARDGGFAGEGRGSFFKSLLSNGSDRLRGGVRLFDMNASPPREADGEGFVAEALRSGKGAPATMAEQNGGKRPIVRDISFAGRSLIAPMTISNILHGENGFSLLQASRGLTQLQPGFGDIVQQRPGRNSKEAHLSSTLKIGIRPSHSTPLNFSSQHQGEVYLQGLRDYIHEKRGILGDGWRVEFFYCKDRCKTFAVYCAPDGSRFESRSDVAAHLGLLTNYHSSEAEDTSDGFVSLHKRLHSDGRRNELLRFSRANNHGQNKNTPRSSSVVGISSGSGIMGHEFESYRSTMEADSTEHGHFGSELLQDLCPFQFEDLVVLSLGKVDPRPSYHNTSQIWPVGYRSCWHDKITGSIFVFEVADGGDDGPNFEVKRYPCSSQPIPIGTTVLYRQNSDSNDPRDKVAYDNSVASGMDDDESLNIKMMLTEDSPPHLEDIDFHKANSSATESSCFPNSYVNNVRPDDLVWVDCIGEFSVEGGSSSMVWEMASQTLLRACHEAYKQSGILRFCCKHNVNRVEVKAADNVDSLSKFCCLSGPTDIPTSVRSNNEFDTFSQMIVKWLQEDRFGLDTEFVQEILEQLPGIHACSEYGFLNKRGQNSGSQTVRSGFLSVKRKRNVQGGKGADGCLPSSKRPRKQLVEDSVMKKSFPLGKPLSAKLPAYLIGDVFQAWEFLWRFSEILGLEETFSFQELEIELLNPWLDTINQLEGDENEIQNCEDFTLCTGVALRKAHSSLLQVVVRELLLKVAGYVDPNADAGECKSKRGRKKDADNSFASKKMKLDMLQINELTWPELARRYILVVLSMQGNLDSGEITCRESSKIFHCLRGDGGTLCGSLTGVAGMEADALFLAEASKKVFGSVTKNDLVMTGHDKSETVSSPQMTTVDGNEVPEWVQALEPARKLPTNVGARIRKCVHEALNKNPPDWAKKILEHSISKAVYKGNASGPTKRAIVSLLEDVSHKNLPPKPDKKEKVKSVSTISDAIMKQCRIVLRRAIAEDEEKVFCNLLGRTLLNHNDNDDEGLLGNPAMVSRPLDFRTLDIRLAAGAYGGSHEAFLDDVREVWNNIRTAYADQSDLIDLAESLYQKFEVMYDEEVLPVVKKFAEIANSSCISDEAQKEIDDMLMQANESSIPKAPWDEGVCKVCGVDKDDDNVLLCDTCDSEYHTYCLSPPLARIPEGNWYCPSCVASQFKSKGQSYGSRVNFRRKKRYRGELTRNFMETLSRLARTMGSKEYWDFNVEERVFLMKFLCDETLNTSILRDHLDHCASMSADLQQKLRLLSSEGKNLKQKEEILAATMEKANAVDNKAGELAPDVLAYGLYKDGKLLGKMPNRENTVSCLSGNFPQLEDGPQWIEPNVYSEQPYRSLSRSHSEKHYTSSRSEIFEGSDTAGQVPSQQTVKGQSLVPDGQFSHTHSGVKGANCNDEQSPSLSHVGEHVPCSEHMHSASALQDGGQEMSSLKHELSVLQDTVARLENDLQTMSIRKEFLGRDSVGRLYWVFHRTDTAPLLVVYRGPAQYGTEYPSSSRGLKVSSVYESMQNNGGATSAWVSYQSDTEIGDIIGWLRDGDARERELKESILHWQRNKPKDLKNAENCVQNEEQPSCLMLSNGGRAADSSFLVTKAVTALEKKYGPGLVSEATVMSKKQGQKCKVSYEGRMYRCECLEPIWPSRHHCQLCHQTYSTSEELDRHSDGKCSADSVITKSNRLNEDSLKGKRIAAETSVKKRPNNNGNGGTSNGEKNETEFNASKFKEPGCPYNFEEIKSKFVTQNSLKELVRDVGLIGSSGTTAFVLGASPYLSDPALRLVPMRKKEVDGGNGSIDRENQLQGSIDGTTIVWNPDYDSGCDNFPNCVGIERDGDASKIERLISNSATKRKRSSDGVGNHCVIPESSLRQLVGRVSQILRQLKIKLLDMDAALPDEALRPSMAHWEKRSAWRAFVKSAGSIFEVVQATVVLENMIKADYLKKEWWYWSSLSSAASISTVSALALRVYTLDAAIVFEKPSPTSDSTETPKPVEPEEGTSPKLETTNDTTQKTHNDPADHSKPRSRPNKRKKDSGG